MIGSDPADRRGSEGHRDNRADARSAHEPPTNAIRPRGMPNPLVEYDQLLPQGFAGYEQRFENLRQRGLTFDCLPNTGLPAASQGPWEPKAEAAKQSSNAVLDVLQPGHERRARGQHCPVTTM